jgi:hypothetical protein
VKRFLSLLLAACFLTSCATITRGTNEVISVDSDPSGADATIKCADNITASGTTPARITIPRKAEGCSLDIAKSGMKSQSVKMERGFNGSFWANFIPASALPITVLYTFVGDGSDSTAAFLAGVGLVGGVGFLVDRFTGAMYDHEPNVIKVTLQPQQ